MNGFNREPRGRRPSIKRQKKKLQRLETELLQINLIITRLEDMVPEFPELAKALVIWRMTANNKAEEIVKTKRNISRGI